MRQLLYTSLLDLQAHTQRPRNIKAIERRLLERVYYSYLDNGTTTWGSQHHIAQGYGGLYWTYPLDFMLAEPFVVQYLAAKTLDEKRELGSLLFEKFFSLGTRFTSQELFKGLFPSAKSVNCAIALKAEAQ
jgi:hypothetical protein